MASGTRGSIPIPSAGGRTAGRQRKVAGFGARRALAIVTIASMAVAAAALPRAAGAGEHAGRASPIEIPRDTLRDAAAAEHSPGKAALYRDSWGVPHVYAAREEDGWFALGWAQAEDQLERLLGLVRSFRGERAAVDGPSALGWDTFQRMWRHREEAQDGWARLDPQVQADYRSFVAGVERFAAEHPERVPANAIDLEPVDLVMLPRALFFLAYDAVEGLADCMRGGVEIDRSIALPGTGTGAGGDSGLGYAQAFGAGLGSTASNGWAVMPARTADGGTIVLSDPHVEIGLPIYWEYRVHAGTLHSSGFMMGALPWQAHTREVAWAMTTGSPDVADCFAIETDPAQPRRYRFDGEWREFEVSTTTIEVAGSSPVERVFEYTRHGGVRSPVVARRGDRAWVVSVAAMHDAGLLDSEIHRMNLARSVGEVRDAMRLLGMFPQTVIAGDRAGGVFYVRAGKSPRRPAGFDWSKPVDGSTSASAWQGFHRLEDHPQIVDPPAGFVFDNNNAPDVALAAARATTAASSGAASGGGNVASGGAPDSTSSAPDYLFHDQPGRTTWRGYRAGQVLAGDDAFTWDDAVALALDQTWPATSRWQDALKHTFASFPEQMTEDVGLGMFFARLIRFDGRARASSVDALTFHYFREHLWRDFEAAGITLSDGPGWREGELDEALAKVVIEHARRARDAWIAGGGEEPLGHLFRIGRDGAHGVGGATIDEPAIPDCRARLSPFCDVTQRALVAEPADGEGRRRVGRGSQALRLVQFVDPIRSFTLHPWGQSQDPASPHYDDQSALAAEPRLKPTWFERDQLLEHLESARVLDTEAGRGAAP